MARSNQLLASALKYCELGLSVIPLWKNKKPHLSEWTQYQTRRATEQEIRSWWTEWPDACIGIVTGKISGITAVDADSEAGRQAVNEFIPDSLPIPMVKTPNPDHYGHYWFQYTDGAQQETAESWSTLTSKTTAGMERAPPSVTDIVESGKQVGGLYQWFDGLKITDVKPPKMPDMLAEVLRNGAGAGNARPPARIKKNASSRTI